MDHSRFYETLGAAPSTDWQSSLVELKHAHLDAFARLSKRILGPPHGMD